MSDIEKGFDKAVKTAKVGLPEGEHERLYQQLGVFLGWLEPLLEVDAAGVEPILLGHNSVNAVREDVALKGVMAELQEAAPDFDEGFYQVPPIIE